MHNKKLKKCEENVTEPDEIMDTLTFVCEKFLFYTRKILCEKLNRLNGGICTFFIKKIDINVLLK